VEKASHRVLHYTHIHTYIHTHTKQTHTETHTIHLLLCSSPASSDTAEAPLASSEAGARKGWQVYPQHQWWKASHHLPPAHSANVAAAAAAADDDDDDDHDHGQTAAAAAAVAAVAVRVAVLPVAAKGITFRKPLPSAVWRGRPPQRRSGSEKHKKRTIRSCLVCKNVKTEFVQEYVYV